MKTTEAIAAHPWVRNAEYAINTDAGNGIIAEDGSPLVYQIQGAEKTYATYKIVATNPGGQVQSRARTTPFSTWLERSSASAPIASP